MRFAPLGHARDSVLFAAPLDEVADGRDYDGNGLLDADVMHVHHPALGGLVNLGLRASVDPPPVVCAERLLFVFPERPGEDLNGDGDFADVVPVFFALAP